MYELDELNKLCWFGPYVDYGSARTSAILNGIDKRKELLKEKNEIIAKLEFEKALIKKDLADIVANEVKNSPLSLFPYVSESNILWETWRYYNKPEDVESNTQLSDEDKKKYKQSLDFVLGRIKDLILLNNNEFELYDVLMYNYGEGYSFYYRYKDKKIEVYIPNFSEVSTKNYESFLGGYGIRYEKSKCVWDLVTSGLDYKKVAEELKNWVNKNCL